MSFLIFSLRGLAAEKTGRCLSSSSCPIQKTAFPPESGCKDTHSCGTGKQNKGLFLKKIREDRKTHCHTGQYTGEIIRGKGGREGNGHIYYIIYTHGRRQGTGAEGQKKVPCSHSKDKVIHLKLSINKSLTYKNQLFQPLTCKFYSFLISCH